MKRISRREFIKVSAIAMVGVAAAACAPTPPPEPEEIDVAPTVEVVEPTKAAEVEPAAAKYMEAPELTAKVQAGELPSVDERLPLNPWVVPNIEMAGQHGGRLRMTFNGTGDKWSVGYWIDRGLLWYDQNIVLKPRLCESFEVNEDATEYVFHLRAGTKWSDGVPFTSQDFVWYREYVMGNETLTPSPSSSWGSKDASGKVIPFDVEAPDDFTVKFSFVAPNGLFVHRVNRQRPYMPSHFMKQWHPDTTEDPAALEKAIADTEMDTWDNLWEIKRWYHLTPELPNLQGWTPRNTMNDEIFIMERNPFFYGVDAEGNQLPYIGELHFRLSTNAETLKLWLLNGEIDFKATALADFTTYKEAETSGGYHLVLCPQGAHTGMQVNLTVKDERLREFFRKRETRLAISHAVNRDEMNDLLYQGMAIPRQYSPISTSPNFYPELSFAHIEYDIEMANQYLDDAGYSERNADGMRVYPDGSGDVIGWIIESTAQPGTSGEDAILMVASYLKENCGLGVSVKPVERNLYDEHCRANEIEAGFWGGDRVVVPLADSSLFIGTQPDRPWCPAWSAYRNSGPDNPIAEEPPADHWIWDIWNTYDEISVEPSAQRRDELFTKIMDIWAAELPYVCYVGEWPVPVLMRNGLRNWVEGTPLDDPTGSIALLNPEQYTWEDPATQSA